MNTQLTDTLSDGHGVSCVAESEARKPQGYGGTRTVVFELESPLCERLSLADIEHRFIVV